MLPLGIGAVSVKNSDMVKLNAEILGKYLIYKKNQLTIKCFMDLNVILQIVNINGHTILLLIIVKNAGIENIAQLIVS
jgi:hypothetical protein